MCSVAGREKIFTWQLSKGLVSLCDLRRSGNRSEQQGGLRRSSVPNPGLTRSVPWILFPFEVALISVHTFPAGTFYRVQSAVEAPCCLSLTQRIFLGPQESQFFVRLAYRGYSSKVIIIRLAEETKASYLPFPNRNVKVPFQPLWCGCNDLL